MDPKLEPKPQLAPVSGHQAYESPIVYGIKSTSKSIELAVTLGIQEVDLRNGGGT